MLLNTIKKLLPEYDYNNFLKDQNVTNTVMYFH
jgi:hypothetical protein